MPRLKNPRHEAFAQAYSTGMSASDAYRATYGTNAKDIATMAWRLSVKVDKRVQEIQADSEHVTHLTIAEKRAIYAKEGRDRRNELRDRLKALRDDSELAKHITQPGTIGVTVNVVTLTEDRRKQLIEKKREAAQWQIANRQKHDTLKLANGSNGSRANGTH